MKAQVAKWGNSLAVRLPKALAERARLSEGQALELSVTKAGAVLLRPAKPDYKLAELVEGITPKNRHAEAAWGGPKGGEAW